MLEPGSTGVSIGDGSGVSMGSGSGVSGDNGSAGSGKDGDSSGVASGISAGTSGISFGSKIAPFLYFPQQIMQGCPLYYLISMYIIL
ncbi:Uncharacterised protein [Legionella longbeachae]|uniref:Uncharacterized protein n=1 Tax=Legionella oakridgensis TaxID=29423 RepID=A0A0W0XG11_9GAMM|nr:hypothetical protein Loak_0705 [Legionella oakridgensis]STY20522.1 Uncharacterised protein [Legionella longbeachae]